jgi:carbamoyl-phosphate synthase large subunit
LQRYISRAVTVSGSSPVLIDRYLQNAIEVDVDAVADRAPDGAGVYVAGIMEHIEEAGIHSGDSACSLPPYSLDRDTIAEIERQTIALARALDVVGLMNVQFAVKDGEVYVLEVNPRASRTVPFVAKATGVPIAKIAARIMAGERLADLLPQDKRRSRSGASHVAVKEAVFPFARFPGVDLILGPEMRSTGEVMGLDADFGRAFAKSQLGSGTDLPLKGCVFVSVRDSDKGALIEPCRQLVSLGFELIATRGTARTLGEAGLPVRTVNKVQEGRPHIVDEMRSGRVQLVFNTTEGAQAIADSFSLRRTALTHGIPYYTTVAGVRAAVQAIGALRRGCLEVAPLQSYL